MNSEQLMSNLRFILSGDELKRVSVKNVENGVLYIDLDLHGLSRRQGQILVKNVININKGTSFVINVIHGFNHGTVLKEMIMEEKWNARVVGRECPAWNPGQTFLTIAA